MARETVFLVIEIVVRLIAYGFYSLEGATNFTVRSVIAFIPESVRKDLQHVIPPTGVEYAKEERWVPVVKNIKIQANNLLYPVLALGIIFVSPTLTGFASMAGFARHMYWGYLEGNGVDTKERRANSAKSFEKICQALIFITGIIVFVPGAAARLDTMYYAFAAIIDHALDNTNGALATGIGWLSGVVAFGTILILCLRFWPKDKAKDPWGREIEKAHAPGSRFLISWTLVLATLFCLGMFGVGLVKEPIANATEATMQVMIKNGTLSKYLTPRLEQTKANAVRLTLPNLPDATYFSGCVMKVERREPSDVKYVEIAKLPTGFEKWNDDKVDVGKEYVYRVIADCSKNLAVIAGGLDARIVGAERMITIAESTKPAPAKPTVVPAAPATTVAGCTNGDCGMNPGLNAYCARHPDICR